MVRIDAFTKPNLNTLTVMITTLPELQTMNVLRTFIQSQIAWSYLRYNRSDFIVTKDVRWLE